VGKHVAGSDGARVTKESRASPVLRFDARLSKAGSGAVLALPKSISQKLGDAAKVEGTINGHPFRAALGRSASGGRSLRVNEAMRRGAGAKAGDTVRLVILGPEPEPVVPADLRSAFKAFPDAKSLWQELDSDGRRIWIRWIESAKKPQTRARRVTRTVEQLSEGKRRPCCVNVYAFMLDRVNA
jgi:hypothetical protein